MKDLALFLALTSNKPALLTLMYIYHKALNLF